ncbi:MAG: TIGR03936 family radical SAM-associated protein [Candidatus Zixiibacteriota bacterium]
MDLSPAFLQSILKPGRYLGGELGPPAAANGAPEPRAVWFYPGSYESAITDPAWRRGYFQLRALGLGEVARGVDYASDVWAALERDGIPPFALGGQHDLRRLATLVIWAPDVFTAGRIPGLLRRLSLAQGTVTVGVVVGDNSAPRFLEGRVDWVIPAPHGWLPQSLAELIATGRTDDPSCYQRASNNWTSAFSGPAGESRLIPWNEPETPQWLPRADIGGGLADVELTAVDQSGVLRARPLSSVVADAHAVLKNTGLDGLRFCTAGFDHSQTMATALLELTRVYNMKRSEVELPPLDPAPFDQHWRAYKPHLIKPLLRLRMRHDSDPGQLSDLGRRALNDGWHALTLVLSFDSFGEFSRLVSVAGNVITAWGTAASGFADRRPLRIEYEPAPLSRWLDPPSAPDESEFRRLSHECRQFREQHGAHAATGHFRIEDVIARNWLAAAPSDIWPALETLGPPDPGHDTLDTFDWCAWVRTKSGLNGPPSVGFARRDPAPPESLTQIEAAPAARVAAVSNGDLYGRRKRKQPFSRRLAQPNRERLRVAWGKTADWRLYSHLDMLRQIERAIRIAGLPVSYSEGFHPRPKVSFGPPLAFGLLSRMELFDVILERSVEPTDIESLTSAVPDGVFITRGEGLPTRMPALNEVINEAVYSTLIPLSLEAAQSAIQELMTAPKIAWTRPDRPDRRPVDPRTSLRETGLEESPEGVRWTLRVSIGQEGGIRPPDWASLIFGFTPDQVASLLIERTELAIRQGNVRRSPFDVF